MPRKKKLIEVALPLEAINAESAREKSIRHGHPSTLHLWWARRPLATARAVIWSSLVDDPSSHPEQFPTEEAQQQERKRLFDILTRLVKWENSNDEGILAEAKTEIMKSTDNNPPALLDPFAGGGAIPLEAQRLGLEAHAHDLNPVAVMINKAMIEIPPKFANMRPVNPESRGHLGGSAAPKGAACLAEDVRYYGEWMKQEAYKRIGHLYPKAKLADGSEATVIAWIWARTAKCQNPACGYTIPLTSSYVISNKKGNCAWVEPIKEQDSIRFIVKTGTKLPQIANVKAGRGAAFVCPACGHITTDAYIKEEALANRMGIQMMAVVVDGKSGRQYLTPDSIQIHAAEVEKPESYPEGFISTNPRWFSPPAFGMTEFNQLFSNRQLTSMVTFSELVSNAQKRAELDAVEAGMYNDHIGIANNGRGAKAYGEAVGVYLAFLVDRLADRLSTLCNWDKGYTKINHTYGRQALPMVWDFAEGNPFSSSTGSFTSMIKFVTDCLDCMVTDPQGEAKQFDAQSDCGLSNIMISTDPPYYDNIGYAELSDYFYIWMRQSLKDTFPKLFRTMLVPKAEELIAASYRHNGNADHAKEFFEEGMYQTCKQINKYSRDDIPVTIYYAFKQSETTANVDGRQTSSTGWETMLTAIIKSGFSITGTWPMRTEMANRMIANGTNALASSIVIACRKRPMDARSVTRREFINALHHEMRPALEKLQSANIAPVDLAQSAIGPGIGVYSRYKSVLEADGKPMSVRAALQIINQELDSFYNEQEGELDRESRFCVELLTYLYSNPSNDRFWYDTRPTLRKTVEDRASQRSEEEVEMEIERRLKAIRKDRPFGRVHVCPDSSMDVSDEQDVGLVILKYRQTYKSNTPKDNAIQAAENILNTRGTAPRIYRNMLAFIAPDQNMMSALREEVKRFLAWKSIKEDSIDLNLDAAQNRETESSLTRSNQIVDARILETYCHLLVPYIDREIDLKTIIWDEISIRGGTDSIVTKAARKMQQTEQLITQWAPALLNMQLDNLLWRDRNDINVGELWKLLCTYCYLPRLASFDVLQTAIQNGVNTDDYFAYADGIADGKYIALKYNQYVGFIDRSGYLVKQVAALKQKAAEAQEKPVVIPADCPPVQPGPKTDVPTPPQPEQPKNRHFIMTATLDTTRVIKNIGNLMDEVIGHLMQVEGANVEIKLLVEAIMPDGTPVTTVRTVTENCKTLHVEDFGFDE